MTGKSSHRHFERFPVEHIVGSLLMAGDVKVVDLSQTGLSFETFSPVVAEEHRELELRYREQSVRVEVLIRWARHERVENGRQVFRAGAEFQQVLEKEPSGLWDFILAEGE